MGEDRVAAGGGCLGALGLDHGRESRETAAADTVGHHRICHQIDVIDQDERDARGSRRGRAGKANAGKRDEQKAGGNTSGNQEHGIHSVGFDFD